ncbi:polysaccharide export protein [Aggregicoccus sp. 17bor-14]|uniref:polysaccharide biosynthesis/export family protein n=1 Tax=Myxococcaceae TaxID=31 RepID=UPI00129CC7B7|nr:MULTISPECIES: polysaccharide biosynthesis/export family protein [Myxococcaceae]MBF5042593.1 polysaccharide export protein [Simulacricoccus sp. 17bor-14]MRI88362.1 polysaccharide export protein [Aggregicoccus sp. 17bor-14]
MSRLVQQGTAAHGAGKGPGRSQGRARSAFGLALGLLALLSGCKHAGAYTWVDQVAPEPEASEYQIVRGDTLSVRVFGQEGMSARARVREDGKISLPFLQDVQVVGYTPPVLAQQLQTRLKDYFANPVVTVALEEPRPFTVSVMGEVARPGLVQVERSNPGVLPALASAGGLTPFADHDAIFVLRPGSPPRRIRFKYEALTTAEGRAAAFRLQSGDVVVVE